MNQEFVNLRDQQVLNEIKEYLEKLQVAATVLEASDNLPVNMLIVVTAEHVSMNIIYLPLPEDHFEEIRLLQFHSLIAEKVDEQRKTDLLVLINAINDRNPFGSFFISSQGELSYKYIVPVNRFEIPKEITVQEIFSLYNSTLMQFRPLLLNLIAGDVSLDDALTQVAI